MQTSSNSNYQGPVCKVAVPSPLRRTFDYLPPLEADTKQLRPGVRVLVPFGNRKLVAVLVEMANGSDLPRSRLKPVTSILDSAALYSSAMMRVLRWASNYYQCPLGEVFATALPANLRSGKARNQTVSFWRASKDQECNSADLLKRALKQKHLFDFIETTGAVTTSQCQQAGFSVQLLRELDKKNLIESFDEFAARPDKFTPLDSNPEHSIALNPEQADAFASIQTKLDQFACILLDGVTGSGKTEVYMRAMQEQLAKGKQCLVLVPEIGLTPQTVMRFEQRFACPVVTLHSGLTDNERLSAWNMAFEGQAGIVIGTRSAIFTPLANPGLIVIDEEHDTSFKQQDGFRYSARDLAVVRAREEKICVILGSATPSLESLHNANSNKFTHLQLRNRAGNANICAIDIVDISSETLQGGFSELLLYKIEKHLRQQNQVLIFINRRGFAPVLNCNLCGWTAECENCVAQLTVHSKPPGLRCHHCGAVKPMPISCPHCQSKNLTTFGMGTQKIETFLIERFPKVPVLRIDRDSVRSKSKLDEMLEQVNRGEPCILLGTQMLAKGHHFPKITLAGILDADVGLFSADFRGQEQMAQTIIQVAGRAGRAEEPGEVLIQSRHAGHPILQCLARGDYAVFTEQLLQERKQAGMPPFAHLGLIRAESTDLQQPLAYLRKVRAFADELISQQQLRVAVLGPLPAPMEKRAGRYRVQLLLRSSNRGALQSLLTHICHFMETGKLPARLRWSVDVDPQDLI